VLFSKLGQVWDLNLSHVGSGAHQLQQRWFVVAFEYEPGVSQPPQRRHHQASGVSIFADSLAWDNPTEYGFRRVASYDQALYQAASLTLALDLLVLQVQLMSGNRCPIGNV
jgi:hypothetical protein